MFFIPKKSKNLINQILLSDFAQRYLNFGNGNPAMSRSTGAFVKPEPILYMQKSTSVFRFNLNSSTFTQLKNYTE
jgi:hypothetical protein